MKKYSFSVLVLGLALISFSCKAQTDKQPNIVFILADDLGYGDLTIYHPESKISTPHLDRLATGGARFTDAHSGSAVCTPTRYGILTGRYAWRSKLKDGVLWPWESALIEEDRLTMGDMLKSVGYTTAAIGKWHLGMTWPTKDGTVVPDSIRSGEWAMGGEKRLGFGHKVDYEQPIQHGPITRGFDYYFGDDVPNYPPYAFIENDKVVKEPTIMKPSAVYGNPGIFQEGWDLTAVMPAIQQRSVAYIRNTEEKFKRRQDKPFFLYLALTAPHTPIAPSEEFIGKSNAGRYGDYVMQVDHLVGEVVKTLEEEGMLDNTLIVFSSDNGSPARDGSNMAGATRSVVEKYGHQPSGRFRGIKASIYEGGHRVPLIVHWPKVVKPAVSEQTVCLTDFMATFAGIVGYRLPQNAGEDSYDLQQVLAGKETKDPVREATVHHSGNGQFAIRRGKWKLVLGGGSGGWTKPRNDAEAEEMGLPMVQLFDLENDPAEENNLEAAHPELVHDLTALLEKYKEAGRSRP
ncbi:arylsulfatase [Echinicola sediminis]